MRELPIRHVFHDRENTCWRESRVRRVRRDYRQWDGETQDGDSPNAAATRTEQKSLHLHAEVL
jgi:hypothetical protein